ncbi:MAG: two-component sensor histidine kinase, partial [Nitrosopumilaceae archaeon]|nr:two-component sensor histidine kinase [Nitrosopumilaceae archaeon]NIP10322.1 two-component sensor histidine kinase [Nitrosopumilaceae archaeon]NIS95185.1 two-component sensor histidine kinase [Nitrosopumilaceae archaeon]
MIKIKQALFLIFGITSFIIFYIGVLNYLTTTDQEMGLTILAFSSIVATGTLAGSFYISKNLTTPIEQLAKKMTEFSKNNTISKTSMDDKGIFELQLLYKNFEDMANKVGSALEKEKQLNSKLQDMDVKKTEFMSMISHELKTPLMPIMGYIQMLKKQDLMGSLNEKQLDAINEILISTKNLQKLIQDMLMVQKIDLGKLSVESEVTESKSLIESAYHAFDPVCQEKNVKLRMSIQATDKVNSDKDRIAQVFSNLISNALAFLPEKNGEIEIGTQDNLDYVVFYVKDNGVGLSISQQKNIFKKFYQADTSSKRKKDGSGLGLSICEGIIKALGGKIWVQSTENKG